ncbi:hypothetical protein CSUI_008180 [Cystoisospora suis]|uniref:Uncharacterized protein n=1 Tax=Cystoisospora suis TaxID=483139 RepID=A0A2C6KN06_9APIC|nr:hypothetical protein CSUI_008180 [Cystoisospora suis]
MTMKEYLAIRPPHTQHRTGDLQHTGIQKTALSDGCLLLTAVHGNNVLIRGYSMLTLRRAWDEYRFSSEETAPCSNRYSQPVCGVHNRCTLISTTLHCDRAEVSVEWHPKINKHQETCTQTHGHSMKDRYAYRNT